ncbi:50S ribosomal protein L30 [Bifidobacterium bombi]|uniref:Large ribosomal subunit protein uL30 n=1 Tax=Bifidobacterium bombi DSM 19703 TaxID=1341695 RepID=A0A086BP23_9BIFI|nr:50S ribosomal protein L30 [Bifidobacterium bombi]KFF30687.1 50S ribosomal protein L30 [Bifidobacterium bombi DSM 19703]
MAKLKITLTKGLVNRKHQQRDTVRTLGLHKIGQSVVREDTPETRGQILAVRHLVTVEEA